MEARNFVLCVLEDNACDKGACDICHSEKGFRSVGHKQTEYKGNQNMAVEAPLCMHYPVYIKFMKQNSHYQGKTKKPAIFSRITLRWTLESPHS